MIAALVQWQRQYARTVSWTTCLPRPIDVSAVLDADDAHDRFIVEHTVDDSILAYAGRTIARQLAFQLPAGAVRIL